jgi:multicomponent Na+:H+ antiporter subunit C
MNIIGLYNYWIVVFLMMIGFYVVIASENLIKKLLGLSIFQTGVFYLYISMGKISGGTAPIFDEKYQFYSSPLTSCLILTAIVVSIATTAVGLALVVRIQEAYGTIEEGEIHSLDTDDSLECELETYGPKKNLNILKKV